MIGPEYLIQTPDSIIHARFGLQNLLSELAEKGAGGTKIFERKKNGWETIYVPIAYSEIKRLHEPKSGAV